MTVESATYVGDLAPANPAGTDYRREGDNHLRLLKTVLQATFPNASKAFYVPTTEALSADHTLVSLDQHRVFFVDTTSAVTLTLPTLASSLAGWQCLAMKITADANALTVEPASGTINGASDVSVSEQFDMLWLFWDGTTWYARELAQAFFSGAEATVTPTASDLVAIKDASDSNAAKFATLSSVLGLSAVKDSTARAMAVLALMNTELAAGMNAVVVAYDFSTDSLATSTNATHDGTAQSYENNGAETLVSQGEGSTQTDYYTTRQSAAYDGNSNQATAAAATGGSGTTIARYGVDFGVGNAKTITGLKTWGSNNGGYCNGNSISVDIVLKASNTDPTTNSWTGTTIGTIAQFTSGTAVAAKETLGNANATAYRYAWAELTFGLSTIATLGEVEFYASATSGNMTLIPDAVTLDMANPLDVTMWVQVDVLNSGDASANVKARFSIDNGATWTTAAVADSISSLPGGTDKKMLRFDADVLLQTGSSFLFEITSLNTEEFEVFEPIVVPLY